MGEESRADERHAKLAEYQVTEAVMAQADPSAIFMHCLPAHRGQEVVSQVIDSPQSVVFDQAENRMHVQNAILLHMLTSGIAANRSADGSQHCATRTIAG